MLNVPRHYVTIPGSRVIEGEGFLRQEKLSADFPMPKWGDVYQFEVPSVGSEHWRKLEDNHKWSPNRVGWAYHDRQQKHRRVPLSTRRFHSNGKLVDLPRILSLPLVLSLQLKALLPMIVTMTFGVPAFFPPLGLSRVASGRNVFKGAFHSVSLTLGRLSERHIQFIVRAYGMRRIPCAPACCVVLLKPQARRTWMLLNDTTPSV